VRALIRRVLNASVKVGSEITGQIGQGLIVYAAIHLDDLDDDLDWMSKKILGLRVFEADTCKKKYSVLDKQFDLLLISQFTLFGSLKKGFHPCFSKAAPSVFAEEKYRQFIRIIRNRFDGHLATGKFGKNMEIISVEDGPLNLWLDSKDRTY
jgi:D-tyrosyl-tRNA(Tyr) deacylase